MIGTVYRRHGVIFADSIEDGMNLAFAGSELYLTTKNSVVRYRDNNKDNKKDDSKVLLRMTKPENPYDHAAILGIAIGPDSMIYVSRGNVGSSHWLIMGTDGSKLEGFGDGGNVFRCRMDGSGIEPIATGFWNPFDIKFTLDGRLMLTDNDPDSRGPNRLIEVVPGGDFGYKSLYGGSGVHPYLAWNAELPGTLPYAAPLGEAPCALIDGGYTSFGEDYQQVILAQIWEENNIVKIPMKEKGSSVTGIPELWIQGDSLFHPVAFATNNKGELYMTDWVVRQYPNHGRGRIWRITSKNPDPNYKVPRLMNTIRFNSSQTSQDGLLEVFIRGDDFQKAMARKQLAESTDFSFLQNLVTRQKKEDLKKQLLLTLFHRDEPLDRSILKTLLNDENEEIRRISLIYTGSKMRTDLDLDLQVLLQSDKVGTELFETYLETIKNIQPAFVQKFKARSPQQANRIPRILPEGYIISILENPQIAEETKALAIPYLKEHEDHKSHLINLLGSAKNEKFKLALLKALSSDDSEELKNLLVQIIRNSKQEEIVRAQALIHLRKYPSRYYDLVLEKMDQNEEIFQYSAIKYLCACEQNHPMYNQISRWMLDNGRNLHSRAFYLWQNCQSRGKKKLPTYEEWTAGVQSTGNVEIGKLIFESIQAQCLNCHRVDGWGGIYGPELSNIGSSKSKSQLIDAILNPSKEIAPAWQGWEVVDQEGTTHYGRQIDIHLDHVELMNETGTFDTYDQPKSYGVADHSLMPEGLQNTMIIPEFNDLIHYLISLK